jgi:hypothetical protein
LQIFFLAIYVLIEINVKILFQEVSCSIDSELFNQLVTTEVDELKVLDQLINYNIVRLSRATEQSRDRPDHIELSRISAEIRNLIQARFIIKRR